MLLYPFWVTSPESYAAFPPGWPAVLSLGERLGRPELVNPVLAALLPLLTYGLAREWTNDRTAGLAALIAGLSPAVWLLGASRMAHTSVLLALASASLVIVRARDRPIYWIGAGAAVAYMVLARPYDAFLLGIPLLLWGLTRAPDRPHQVGLIGPVVMAICLLAVDNHSLTGDPTVFPIQQWADSWYTHKPGCDRLGIGSSFGCLGVDHTASRALELSMDTALRLDRTLIGIPGGLLLALAGLALLRERAAWALVVLIAGGYSLYWSPGAAYGARFWHPMMLVLPIGLAVLAIRVQERWAQRIPAWTPSLVIGIICAAGGSQFLPELADRYWCVDGSLARQIQDEGIEDGVVLVQAHGLQTRSWNRMGTEDFVCNPMLASGAGLQLMDPTRSSGGLQVRHALPEAAEQKRYLRQHHPGAPAWLYTSDLNEDSRTWEPVEISEDP
jgi:hypothetical protein